MGKPVKNPLNNVPAGKNGRQKYPTVPTAPKKGRQLYVKEKSYLANKKKYDTALPGKLSIVRSDGARVERDMYNQLNELISDVQTARIVAHKFLDGYRVPDENEVEADKLAKEEQEKLDKLKAEAEAAALPDRRRSYRLPQRPAG